MSAEIFTQHAKRKQKRVLYHVPAILTSVFICDILLRFSILLWILRCSREIVYGVLYMIISMQE